jgi:nicotinate-nucleotide pyrophosphorylase (carboxylating)
MSKNNSVDLRDKIFRNVACTMVTACIIADEDGIVAEMDIVAEEAARIGLFVEAILKEGTHVSKGDEIVRFRGTPKQTAMAEEVLIGLMSKPSGIATAMHGFMQKAGPKLRVVCGAWKKMPPQIKEPIRRAIVVGGGFFRATLEPFIYLDKNYIEMLGGVQECLTAVSRMDGLVKVVQLKGRYKDIAQEACEAVRCGASIIFIDTGRMEDIGCVSRALSAHGLRRNVKIAFAGNIRAEDIETLKSMDVDILDVGRAIVDAPLLDMRMEVAGMKRDA